MKIRSHTDDVCRTSAPLATALQEHTGWRPASPRWGICRRGGTPTPSDRLLATNWAPERRNWCGNRFSADGSRQRGCLRAGSAGRSGREMPTVPWTIRGSGVHAWSGVHGRRSPHQRLRTWRGKERPCEDIPTVIFARALVAVYSLPSAWRLPSGPAYRRSLLPGHTRAASPILRGQRCHPMSVAMNRR